MNLDGAISVIKDPFTKDCVTAFRTSCHKSWVYPYRWVYKGHVEFKNGNTSGQQDFEAEDYKSLLIKMEAFMNQLESK